MMRREYEDYRLCIEELGLRPQPVLYSKYPTPQKRLTHEQVQQRNLRVKNRLKRGHLGH